MSARPRPATLDDLPRLLELDATCFARPWTPADWRAELADGPLRPLVLVVGEPFLGCVAAPMLDERCELRRIAVLPSARGRGLGRDLLAAVIAHARLAGCTRVELEVAHDNHAAGALYRAAGFVEVGRRPRYYRNPPADALLLTLALQRPNAIPAS